MRKHAQTLRAQQEPNLDGLVTIVEDSEASYLTGWRAIAPADPMP